MKCKKCGGSTRVMDTTKDNLFVYRKRVCKKCKKIFFTEEMESRNQSSTRHFMYICKNGYTG